MVIYTLGANPLVVLVSNKPLPPLERLIISLVMSLRFPWVLITPLLLPMMVLYTPLVGAKTVLLVMVLKISNYPLLPLVSSMKRSLRSRTSLLVKATLSPSLKMAKFTPGVMVVNLPARLTWTSSETLSSLKDVVLWDLVTTRTD